MSTSPIYTIGHGSRKAEAFAGLLQEAGIAYLIDVRSQPYSRHHPQFNRYTLNTFLKGYGITYVYMGDSLGGRPADEGCYDAAGRVDYKLVRQRDFFRVGIKRLRTAYEKGIRIALMCSESDPCRCHRSLLIGTALQEEAIPLLHIDEKGRLKDQATVLRSLEADKTLFDEDLNPIT